MSPIGSGSLRVNSPHMRQLLVVSIWLSLSLFGFKVATGGTGCPSLFLLNGEAPFPSRLAQDSLGGFGRFLPFPSEVAGQTTCDRDYTTGKLRG